MAAQRHRPHRGLPFVLSALAAAVLLAGCASTRGLAPDGHMIEADSLSGSRSLGTPALSDAAFPAQDWWTALGDPQLDALVREALQDSPSLAAADARVRQAQAQAGLADAARKPTLGGSAQYAVAQLPKTLAPGDLSDEVMHNAVLTLSFKWPLDVWAGKRAEYEAALGQARATEVDAQAARLALAANVARGYVALAQAFDALDVAQREQARATRLHDLGKQRVDAGLDNQLQLRQAESLIASARQQAQAAQQQIDAGRNALAALLGKGPDRGLDIERPQLLQAPPPTVPGVLPSELLGHRPDVVAARWRVEASSRGIDAAKAKFKPSVNLSALAGLASVGLSDLFSSDALLGFGGPAISLPIFDGGALRSQLAKSDADYDLAVAGYNQTLVGALHEVTDAVQAARSLDAQIAAATQARDAAQSALELADTRYHAGLGTQLDVLSAQRPLLQLEQQLAALGAQRYAATIDLDRALGGGLEPAMPEPETASNPDLAKAPTP
jgi:NodT family efflux transporter outer membrane factor (OMF) lipoprotein